jgi:hypothetical protein
LRGGEEYLAAGIAARLAEACGAQS